MTWTFWLSNWVVTRESWLVDAHTDMVINALVNVLSPWHMGWTGTICRHPAVKRNQSKIAPYVEYTYEVCVRVALKHVGNASVMATRFIVRTKRKQTYVMRASHAMQSTQCTQRSVLNTRNVFDERKRTQSRWAQSTACNVPNARNATFVMYETQHMECNWILQWTSNVRQSAQCNVGNILIECNTRNTQRNSHSASYAA